MNSVLIRFYLAIVTFVPTIVFASKVIKHEQIITKKVVIPENSKRLHLGSFNGK